MKNIYSHNDCICENRNNQISSAVYLDSFVYNSNMDLQTVKVIRYVTPLREGGSLPAIIEGDDNELYVLKFRGAGQGVKALIAELIAGEIARILDFQIPKLILAKLDGVLAKTEPDPEIQDLIKFSSGINLGMKYLPGSITFDPLIEAPDPLLAAKIVWFDAFIANVDRTPRNANLLYWHNSVWLIDHGAAFYFHHNWERFLANAENPFSLIKDHILLKFAGKLEEADKVLSENLNPQVFENIVQVIPDEWLENPEEQRKVYLEFLTKRLAARQNFVEEAINVGKLLV